MIIIKLADRLHNMRTLDYLPPEKRRRIAQETRDLYAPLGAPLRYGEAALGARGSGVQAPRAGRVQGARAQKSRRSAASAKRSIEQMADPLERAAARRRAFADVEVSGRPKHLWSIYKKMKQREKPYEEIYDLLAIRVLVNSVPDCYHALGVIHDGWTPVQERIKDYIAQPKSNGYQSLHTTVFGPGRQLYEIQIRTRDMHRTAEYGIAAHWRYKEDAKSRRARSAPVVVPAGARAAAWTRKTPDEFLEFLKLDLYQDEIFVFTPTGDVIQLPKGATPIDFAFAVHTEIGLHCPGAKVNGRIAPLSRPLRNSETVEIITSPHARPSATGSRTSAPAARGTRSASVLKREEQTSAEKLGQEMLDREVQAPAARASPMTSSSRAPRRRR